MPSIIGLDESRFSNGRDVNLRDSLSQGELAQAADLREAGDSDSGSTMLRNKPLALLTWADIEALAAEGVQEGNQLDFKGILEPSGRGGEIRSVLATDDFRRKIARSLMAFANSDGGTVVIGQDEVRDADGKARPDGVAGELQPFADPQGECDRLLRSVSDLIEPRLPIESEVVVNPTTGTGVIVLAVGRSATRPHASAKRDAVAPARAGKECRPMGIREIKEMTLAAARDLESRAKRFDGLMREMHELAYNKPTTQVTYVGALAAPLSAIRVPTLNARSPYVRGDILIDLAGRQSAMPRIGAYNREMKPYLHGLRGRARGQRSSSEMIMRFDGSVQTTIEFAATNIDGGRPVIPLLFFEREFMLAAADSVTNALILRQLAGDDTTEIGIKIAIADRGRANVQGWDQDGSDDDQLRLLDRENDFEVRRFANAAEAAACLAEIRADFWRALGEARVPTTAVEFHINQTIAAALR